MGSHHAPPRPALVALRRSLSALAVTAGALTVVAPFPRPGVPAAVVSPPAAAAVAMTVPAAVAAPVRVQVPSIGVDSTLARLGVDGSGALVPPSDFDQAGWFAEGPAPGDVGPAVIAGHVDSWTGPAVFIRLAEIAVGDSVLVGRSDGTTARFTVTRVTRHPKSAFPTAEVYGPTVDPQLRLITCGGHFDRSARSYLDNVIVYAALTG